MKEITTTEETGVQVKVTPNREIDAFIRMRTGFIKKVNAICIEGKDYHIIKGKKSLAKGGAEKIASIFHWTAKFEKDQESLDMLGDIKGLVAFKCTLVNGQFVGEGRGSAMLSGNGNDANKTLKMAQKSAFIDAVLRSSGLSDFFTQDLEDMSGVDIKAPRVVAPAKPKDRKAEAIALLSKLGVKATDNIREKIKHFTGMDASDDPEIVEEIISRLQVCASEIPKK